MVSANSPGDSMVWTDSMSSGASPLLSLMKLSKAARRARPAAMVSADRSSIAWVVSTSTEKKPSLSTKLRMVARVFPSSRHLAQGTQRFFAPHEKRDHHVRKNHDVPQGQEWYALQDGFVFAMIGHGTRIVSTAGKDS